MVGNFFKRQWIVPYLFLAPALLATIAFKLYPIFIGFWESLIYTSFGGGVEKRMFVWFENYQYLFDDPLFWQSLKITSILTIIINPFQIALSLGLALLLMRKSKYLRIIRSLYLLPIGVALPIATVVWGLMLDPYQGLVNGFLGLFGVPPQPFLVSEDQALWSIIAIATWKGVAFWMLFLLAGMEEIPTQYYEAAKIDGANHYDIFIKIILPLSIPAFASIFILQFLWVWNDLLVGLVFLDKHPSEIILTAKLKELLGSRGENWEILTTGAFISMSVPLLIFFSLQRYFIRGLVAGSVKG